VECAERGADLSIGSRYATGVNVVKLAHGPCTALLLCKFLCPAGHRHAHPRTTAGFVCYRRKVLEAIPLDRIKFIGYAFQIEMKFIAWKFGFQLREVPIISPSA